MHIKKLDLPEFSAIDIATIEEQLDAILSQNRLEIDELTQQTDPTWATLMTPLEEVDERLSLFWGMVSHLNSVVNSKQLRLVYEACLPKLTQYQSELGHNKQLFQHFITIQQGSEYDSLNYAQRKALDNNIRDFKLSGIDLDERQQQKYTEMCQHVAQAMNQFEQNLLDATAAFKHHVVDVGQCQGIPDSALQAAKLKAEADGLDGYLFTLDLPSYLAVIQYADSRELRQTMYTAYATRASDQGPNANQFNNEKIMETILQLRQEIAGLLQFSDYAAYSLVTKMVSHAEDVLRFLDELARSSKPRAEQEFQDLCLFARTQLGLDDLCAWDVSYASEKLRMREFDINDEQLRPYFPVEVVMRGMFDIAGDLFQIKIEALENVDVWHNDVRVYSVKNQRDEVMAVLYLDLFARENKRSGAWMTDFRTRRQIDAEGYTIPIAFISCNFAAATGDLPALLRHDDVVTLFHEFGHSLQHMLTTINYLDVAGLNGIPWDAVEIASQLMENWAWQQEGIERISAHYRTAKPLPDAILQRLREAKNFQSGLQMMRQLEFSLFDMRIHMFSVVPDTGWIQQQLNDVRDEVSVVPVPEFNRFQHGFAHIFAGGYAAGYYSYKWAEVMAQDIFALFLECGIFNKEVSDSFKNTFLAQGGAVDPMDLFVQFRGRKPKIEALLTATGIIE